MPIRIETTEPRAKGVDTVLSESHALMQRLFPPEHNSFLDFDALAAPEITLWAARDDSTILGTVALKAAGEYGEIKSLFVMPEARGRGVAVALLTHAEAAAQARGITVLRLETGNLLEAAGRLYTRAGYVQRGPFGAYEENGTSVFYEKVLTACGTTD